MSPSGQVRSNLERIKEAIGDELGIMIESIVQFFISFADRDATGESTIRHL
jgi:hypothetical protein